MILTDYLGKLIEKLGPGGRFPERDEEVTCPYPSCSRVMLFRDVFEHFFLKHTELGRDNEETGEDSGTIHVQKKSVRGQLVDDYDAEWLDEETEGEDELSDIIQASETQREELREKRMKNAWRGLLTALKNQDKVEFGPNDHYGNLRGRHIGRQLERTLARVDLPLEVEYKGHTTIVRKTGDISGEF